MILQCGIMVANEDSNKTHNNAWGHTCDHVKCEKCKPVDLNKDQLWDRAIKRLETEK